MPSDNIKINTSNISIPRLLEMSSYEFNRILKGQQTDLSYKNDQRLYFFNPGFIYYKTEMYSTQRSQFPAVSVTGRGCSLNCAHCGRKKLTTMLPATTSEELFELANRLASTDSKGFLLSGGCLPNGAVDFEKVLPAIKKIKQELDLQIFVHTGLVSRQMACRLKEVGVDAALIDIIGSTETIRQVYGLETTPFDYYQSLKNLQEQSISTVPHVVVGLHRGRLKGEFKALEMISRCSVSALVIIAFTPLPDTSFEHESPPKALSVAKVIMAAKMLAISPIVLGCVRPVGEIRREIERLAVDLGVSGIAFPSQETIDYSKKIGKSISFHRICCAQIFQLIQEEKYRDKNYQ